MIYRVHIKIDDLSEFIICEAASPLMALEKAQGKYPEAEIVDVTKDWAKEIITG